MRKRIHFLHTHAEGVGNTGSVSRVGLSDCALLNRDSDLIGKNAAPKAVDGTDFAIDPGRRCCFRMKTSADF